MDKAIPPEVKAAVEHLNADPAVPHDKLEPGQLLDFRVYADKVSVIIFTGQKYTLSLEALAKRLKPGKSPLPDNTLKQ